MVESLEVSLHVTMSSENTKLNYVLSGLAVFASFSCLLPWLGLTVLFTRSDKTCHPCLVSDLEL